MAKGKKPIINGADKYRAFDLDYWNSLPTISHFSPPRGECRRGDDGHVYEYLSCGRMVLARMVAQQKRIDR